MIPILRTLIGSIIIANFADIRLFADLRKKHEYNDPNKENSETTSPIITIDGDYTEK
jgi:hypothetical protein